METIGPTAVPHDVGKAFRRPLVETTGVRRFACRCCQICRPNSSAWTGWVTHRRTDQASVARPAAAEQPAGEWLLNERCHARFERRFKLPQTVGDQSIQAKLEDGVLTVTLAKREESKPRRVPVQ